MRTHAPRIAIVAALLTAVTALVPAAGMASAKRQPRKAAAPLVPPVVGIAEQHPDLFMDPLFSQAGLRHSRLLVGWNGIYDDNQRAQMDAYLNTAHALNIDVLVTFGYSRANGRDRPTPAGFV